MDACASLVLPRRLWLMVSGSEVRGVGAKLEGGVGGGSLR